MPRRITHVIYDMDGLLLNTEPFYTKANQAIAARYGKTFDWSLKSRVIGLRAADTARILVEAIPLPITPDEYIETRRQMLEELFPQAEPMPGAVRLTRHLHRHSVPQAVASSSDLHHFDLKTSRHKEWLRIFQCFVIGADPEVKQGKPAPDIFLVTARRLGANPPIVSCSRIHQPEWKLHVRQVWPQLPCRIPTLITCHSPEPSNCCIL